MTEVALLTPAPRARSRRGRSAVLGLAIVMAGGCASHQELLRLSDRVQAIELERVDLRDELGTIRTRNADLSAEISRLDGEVRAVRGDLDAAQNALEQARSGTRGGSSIDRDVIDRLVRLKNELADLRQRLDRIEGVDTSTAPAPSGTGMGTSGVATAGGATAGGMTTGVTTTEPTFGTSIEPDVIGDPSLGAPADAPRAAGGAGLGAADPNDQLYRQSFRAFSERRFQEARAGFTRYLSDAPADAERAGNAAFWLAKSYYAEKEFERAVVAYDRVIKEFPDHEKAPYAMLEQALCFEQLDYRRDAQNVLEKLIERYPSSESARQARERLRSLEGR